MSLSGMGVSDPATGIHGCWHRPKSGVPGYKGGDFQRPEKVLGLGGRVDHFYVMALLMPDDASDLPRDVGPTDHPCTGRPRRETVPLRLGGRVVGTGWGWLRHGVDRRCPPRRPIRKGLVSKALRDTGSRGWELSGAAVAASAMNVGSLAR